MEENDTAGVLLARRNAWPTIKATLWAALAQAEERQALLKELANGTPLPPEGAEDYAREARDMQSLAGKIRGLVGDPLFDRSERDDG